MPLQLRSMQSMIARKEEHFTKVHLTTQSTQIRPPSFQVYIDKPRISFDKSDDEAGSSQLDDSTVLTDDVFALLTQVQSTQENPPIRFDNNLEKNGRNCGKILPTIRLQSTREIAPPQRRPLASISIDNLNLQQHHNLYYDAVKKNSQELFNDSSNDENSILSIANSVDEESCKVFPDKKSKTPPSTEKSTSSSTTIVEEDEFLSKDPYVDEKERHLSLIYAPQDLMAEIYQYARELEILPDLRPKAHYMSKQTRLTLSMRSVLIDWMVDVSVEYHLLQETLHLAIYYVDRFLSLMVMDKDKLQLLGTTALFLAAKFEEIYPPELHQFVFVTDESCTASQVLKMERVVLSTLNFRLSYPTVNYFLDHFMQICRSHQRCKYLAQYLSDLVLLDLEFLHFTPSIVAAAILCVANLTTESVPWPLDLEQASQYTIADIYECMELVVKTRRKHEMEDNGELKAVPEKYRSNKYHQVALITPIKRVPPLQ